MDELIKSIVGKGYESTLSLLVGEEIDTEAFMLLDENRLKETGELHVLCLI